MERSGRQGSVLGDVPAPVSFRTEPYRAGTRFPRGRNPWGELNYALSGVCQFDIQGTRYLSPPSYGLWIPPGVEHEAWSQQEIVYVTTYVDAALCSDLPEQVRTLAISPLLKAILADFATRDVTLPQTEADFRLAQVLIDQIRIAPRFDSYLPFTQHPSLSPIIRALQDDPGMRVSLAEWARRSGVTERTMSRQWRQELGIGFNEWRQRLKVTTSLALLDSGCKVQDVAARVGYNDASAFIAMFRRMTGVSPTQLHRLGSAGAIPRDPLQDTR